MPTSQHAAIQRRFEIKSIKKNSKLFQAVSHQQSLPSWNGLNLDLARVKGLRGNARQSKEHLSIVGQLFASEWFLNEVGQEVE